MTTATQHIHGLAIYNIAVGKVDGNLLSVILFLRFDIEHVRDGQLWNVIILVQFQTTLDFGLDLLGEHDLVYEFSLDVVLVFGKGHDAVVGQLVQVFSLHLAPLSHLLQPVVPDTIQISLPLFTVIIAHARQRIALHITLIFTDFGHLVLDAEFVVESLHVFTFATKSLEVDHAMIVQVDLVGHGSHIIGSLHILVGVGNNPFAALLKLLQFIAQLLGSGGSIETGGASL